VAGRKQNFAGEPISVHIYKRTKNILGDSRLWITELLSSAGVHTTFIGFHTDTVWDLKTQGEGKFDKREGKFGKREGKLVEGEGKFAEGEGKFCKERANSSKERANSTKERANSTKERANSPKERANYATTVVLLKG
jgi:hypothetical protein